MLFDGLFICHGLGQEERKLLGLAAFLKDIGNSISHKERARVSREILLTHSIKGLRLHETLMLAMVAELQDPHITEKSLISTLKGFHTKLPPGFQNKALMLAAIMPIADLFESLEIRPGKIRQLEDALEIEIIGSITEKAAIKFETKSKLWKSLSGSKLLFSQGAEEEKVRTEEESKTKETEIKKQVGEEKKPGKKQAAKEKKPETKKCSLSGEITVKPTDSMALLACRIFSYQFSCMLSHEEGTIKGEEIEELHDMRVAVRRMRAAAKVFETYLDSEQLEPHLKGLQENT